MSDNNAEEAFDNVKSVDIDEEGVFKYVLIKVHLDKDGNEMSKHIVRG